MKCTACNEGVLTPSFIDSLFRAHTCNHCGGNWILVEDFLAWQENNPEHQFDDELEYEEELSESSKALFCPITGSLMTKFRISSKTSHRIDYSVTTGGIWLDQGEWLLLKQEGIAGSLNRIVTQPWQNKIRAQNTKDNFIHMYESKFGKENYAKVKELKNWLQSHPQKADLRAYLLADDPYSAKK